MTSQAYGGSSDSAHASEHASDEPKLSTSALVHAASGRPYTTSVPIAGVSTFASPAEARAAIFEHVKRTAKALATDRETLSAIETWSAQFDGVNEL